MHWPGCPELQRIFTLKWNLIESCDYALFLQPNLAQSRAFEFQPHCSHREEKDSSSQHPIWFQAELISRLIKRLDEFSTDVCLYAAWLKILDLPSHRVLFRRTVTAGSFEMGTSSCRPRQKQMNLIRDAFCQKDRHLCFSSHALFLRGEKTILKWIFASHCIQHINIVHGKCSPCKSQISDWSIPDQ